ncbi:MAG: mechanosensitive ion channel protein, partial [Pseudomonadota bacterium]
DTDVEKLRKLIKKMGQELLEHPEHGPLFIDPVKSQGVVQMEDSAMIIRVKFKTKPGDQFLVRRHVFTRLRDLFAANDIHFAHREVTVRVAGTDDEEEKRKAALGAVRSGGIEPQPGASAADVASVL